MLCCVATVKFAQLQELILLFILLLSLRAYHYQNTFYRYLYQITVFEKESLTHNHRVYCNYEIRFNQMDSLIRFENRSRKFIHKWFIYQSWITNIHQFQYFLGLTKLVSTVNHVWHLSFPKSAAFLNKVASSNNNCCAWWWENFVLQPFVSQGICLLGFRSFMAWIK